MIPRAVYWDTSSLRELPFNLQDAVFQTLRDLCAEYGITMYVTRLCAEELAELRREEFSGWARIIEDPPAWVSHQLGNPVDVKWASSKDQVLAAIGERVGSTIESQGIEIIENAEIPQSRLLEMAVKKIPPFKDKGRGYRDAITLLTIIGHERARAGSSGCIVIAKDADLQAAPKLPDARGLDLTVVRSPEEAIQLIRDRMADFAKARFQEEQDRLKAFLESRRDEIQDFIRRHAPSPRGALIAAKRLGILDTVETIDADSIEFVDVDSAFAVPPSDGSQAWVDLSVTVNVRAKATVELSSTAAWMWGVDAPQQYPREQLIETKAIISGSVLARRSVEGSEYADLSLRRLRWDSPMSQMLREMWRNT